MSARAIDPIDEAARIWATEQERAVTEHPGADQLVDFQEGRLDPAGIQRLREHLASCSTCRQELLLLQEFDSEVADDSTLLPTEQATERSWERFRAVRADRRSTAGPTETGPSFRLLMAASLVVALGVGALLGVTWVSRDGLAGVADSGSPFIFDLDPTGTRLLRDAAGVHEVVVPRGMDPLVARLNLSDLTSHDAYEVDVSDGKGRLALRRDGLVRHRTGSIAFMIPRSSLPEGTYTVSLTGIDSGERVELATFAFRIRYDT